MAYTEDKAFELIESAHSRGRLGHAFILSGVKADMESLATRVINLINKEDENAAPKRTLHASPKVEPKTVQKEAAPVEKPKLSPKTQAEPEPSLGGGLDLFGNPLDEAPAKEEPAADNDGGDLFDLFGEVEAAPASQPEPKPKSVAQSEPIVEQAVAKPAPAAVVAKKPMKQAENLDELEGDLVRIVRPYGKARFIRVDEIRELEKAMYQAAEADKWKVGVIVDADRMQAAASNAFLKTLEEPPNGCLLMLLTHSPERLLPTILSRCVNISLMSDGAERIPLEGESEMIATLLRVGKQGFSSVSRALTIKAVFATLLNKRRIAISKDHEATQKEEEKHYKNATDGEWLKDREKHFESLTQSDYLLERSKFIDLLILWLGDLVRLKTGAPRLEFQQHESAMMGIAEKENLESLLRRMEALEDLRGMFETNVSEALALEVGFMKAFG